MPPKQCLVITTLPSALSPCRPVAFACTVKLLEVEPSSRYAGSLYLVNTFHACIADLTKPFGVLSLVAFLKYVRMCICLHTQRPAVGVRQYGAGFQVGPLEEREVLTIAEPSHPVACLFCLVGL